MKFRFSLYIALAVGLGGLFLYSKSRHKPAQGFQELNHYESQAGDLFYFRAADNIFVLLERRKALAVAVSPSQNLIAFSYPEELSLSRRGNAMWENRIFMKTKIPYQTLAFSPDGRILASGSSASLVTLWDVVESKISLQLEQPGPVLSLVYSPKGEKLAIGLDRNASPLPETVAVLNALNLQEISRFGTEPATSLAFSQDGKLLAVGFSDGSISVRENDFKTPIQTIRVSTSSVAALDFHPGGHILASGHADKKIYLWNRETGQSIHIFEPKSPVNKLFPRGVEKISFDGTGGRLAAAYADGEFRVWKIGTGSQGDTD